MLHRSFEKLHREDRIGEVVQISLEVSEPRTRTIKEKKAYLREPSKITRGVAQSVSSTCGATVLGTPHKTSPDLATFANGFFQKSLVIQVIIYLQSWL